MRRLTALLNVLLSVGVLIAGAVVGMTHDAPLAPWLTDPIKVRPDSKPHNLPAWTDALERRFPGCGPDEPRQWHDVIVVNQRNRAARMHFADAWTLIEHGDDVWVVGFCDATWRTV